MKNEVERLLGTNINKCIEISRNQTARIFNCDDRFIVKESENSSFLHSEAMMLEFLSKHSLPTPEVLSIQNKMLITRYIKNGGGYSKVCEKQIARVLAKLHQIKGDFFGFFEDTTIGPFVQPNMTTDNWIDFYKDHRIDHFAKKALYEGILSDELYNRLAKLGENLDQFIHHSPSPSLIHGDIWSGNVLTYQNRLQAFIDPAIYFADREVELAFIAMFGTFSQEFFKEYDRVYPIEKGFWHRRIKIYQIYPVLIHILIYGRSYVRQLERILDEFGV